MGFVRASRGVARSMRAHGYVKERGMAEKQVGTVAVKRNDEKRAKGGRVSTNDASHLIARHFTTPGKDPLDEVVWERRTSVITNPDGSTVFKLEGAEVPAHFSQLA